MIFTLSRFAMWEKQYYRTILCTSLFASLTAANGKVKLGLCSKDIPFNRLLADEFLHTCQELNQKQNLAFPADYIHSLHFRRKKNSIKLLKWTALIHLSNLGFAVQFIFIKAHAKKYAHRNILAGLFFRLKGL